MNVTSQLGWDNLAKLEANHARVYSETYGVHSPQDRAFGTKGIQMSKAEIAYSERCQAKAIAFRKLELSHLA